MPRHADGRAAPRQDLVARQLLLTVCGNTQKREPPGWRTKQASKQARLNGGSASRTLAIRNHRRSSCQKASNQSRETESSNFAWSKSSLSTNTEHVPAVVVLLERKNACVTYGFQPQVIQANWSLRAKASTVFHRNFFSILTLHPVRSTAYGIRILRLMVGS